MMIISLRTFDKDHDNVLSSTWKIQFLMVILIDTHITDQVELLQRLFLKIMTVILDCLTAYSEARLIEQFKFYVLLIIILHISQNNCDRTS
jgi:hypothetical protein